MIRYLFVVSLIAGPASALRSRAEQPKSSDTNLQSPPLR
jgi:hypothetical protein